MIHVEKKTFYIDEFDQHGWVDRDTNKHFLTTAKLADKYLNEFLTMAKDKREKRQIDTMDSNRHDEQSP
jgi:hypothetical protein